MAQSLLEAEGLAKRYGGLIANTGVNLRLAPGEIRGLIGPNGAGKTTFVNLLTGIEKADAGRISFGGIELAGLPPHRIAVQTSGVDVERLDAVAFAIGVALAGFAGALLAPLFMVFPTNGAVTTVKGFEIIVIGGLGSIPGALVGGLLLGVVESLGAAFISSPYQNVYGFLLVILVLLVKPTGLFGERGREA